MSDGTILLTISGWRGSGVALDDILDAIQRDLGDFGASASITTIGLRTEEDAREPRESRMGRSRSLAERTVDDALSLIESIPQDSITRQGFVPLSVLTEVEDILSRSAKAIPLEYAVVRDGSRPSPETVCADIEDARAEYERRTLEGENVHIEGRIPAGAWREVS